MKGRRIPYSAAELRFLAKHGRLPRRQLHTMFQQRFHRPDVTFGLLRDKCERLGLRVGNHKPWTPEQDALLRALYFDTPGKVVARRTRHTLTSVYQRARKLGLERNREYLTECGRAIAYSRSARLHRFKKGSVPANKGVKRPRGWAPGRMRETQFKKGESTNKMPLGATRLIGGYEYTKVAEVPLVRWMVNWKPTHVLRWEAAHGPIPPKHALKCLDGNRRNTDPGNWVCIHRTVLCRLNRSGLDYDHAPPELRPAILALAKVRAAVGSRRAANGIRPRQTRSTRSAVNG